MTAISTIRGTGATGATGVGIEGRVRRMTKAIDRWAPTPPKSFLD